MLTPASLPQTLTPFHAKYYAYELTRRCPPDSDDRLASALVDAQVDLNPHQIDAVLFSFKSPLSRGVLLADEVGLGNPHHTRLELAGLDAPRDILGLRVREGGLARGVYDPTELRQVQTVRPRFLHKSERSGTNSSRRSDVVAPETYADRRS